MLLLAYLQLHMQKVAELGPIVQNDVYFDILPGMIS